MHDQIGLESTPEEYVAHLVDVFREVRRVLRGDGTLWLNLGDSYCATTKGSGGHNPKQDSNAGAWLSDRAWSIPPGLKPKDIAGIPWRVAFALQADGWWLRSEIIWAKPSPMPESVTDRPTKSHEHLFLLAKSALYFYDAESIKEPAIYPGDTRHLRTDTRKDVDPKCADNGRRARTGNPTSINRNRRSVWTIATVPYPEAHFATFPPDLVAPCVLAGTSERGACPACGAPWVRVVERSDIKSGRAARGKALTSPRHDGSPWNENGGRGFMPVSTLTLDWRPSCLCKFNREPYSVVPCTVLDPFAGSGTTLAVAQSLGRRSIGIELNPEYVAMIERRCRQGALL
jgi:DNA modification methylase